MNWLWCSPHMEKNSQNFVRPMRCNARLNLLIRFYKRVITGKSTIILGKVSICFVLFYFWRQWMFLGETKRAFPLTRTTQTRTHSPTYILQTPTNTLTHSKIIICRFKLSRVQRSWLPLRTCREELMMVRIIVMMVMMIMMVMMMLIMIMVVMMMVVMIIMMMVQSIYIAS